jgi:peptide-methionine (S)-S-oxide reductase
MECAYYPGCSLESTARPYDVSLRRVFERLGSRLRLTERCRPVHARRALAAAAALFALAGGILPSASIAGPASKGRARATFAGGCFWSMEPVFDAVKGVVSTTSGYAGGIVANPTYEQVASGGTGHAEVVQVIFDPSKVSYERLLEVFWRNVDPLDKGGQFCDRGLQYRSAIFYETGEQKEAALASRESLEKSGRLPGTIATGIVPLQAFYPAEEEHQDFSIKRFREYWSYRAGCGRDRRLRELWGEPEGKRGR